MWKYRFFVRQSHRPQQQLLGMNRPPMPAAAGQPSPVAYPYMMSQAQFGQQQQQQQFRSTNTPPTNPVASMASPVQASQSLTQATTPIPANPGTPTPSQQAAGQQSPITNRMQPQVQPNQVNIFRFTTVVRLILFRLFYTNLCNLIQINMISYNFTIWNFINI